MKKLIMIFIGLFFYILPLLAMESESFFNTALQSGIQFKQNKDITNKQVLLRKVRKEGFIRIIVDYDMEKVHRNYIAKGKPLSPKKAIAETHRRFIKDISNRKLNFSGINKVVGRPRIAMSVDEDALKALYEFQYIQRVTIERIFKPHLLESTSIINADDTWDLGFSGEGEIIVIIDTGVDPDHEMLEGKVIDGACFSTDDFFNNITSLCPNGSVQYPGMPVGENCTGIQGCDHGTHVAGIAAGNGSNLKGVAYGADIISIQVFSKIDVDSLCVESTPCLGIMEGDLDEALSHIYYYFHNQKNYKIAAVNMSLGGGKYLSECNNDPLAPSISNLIGAGISVVASSGNEGFTNAMASPACIPGVISVGATNNEDEHWTESDSVGSNSAPFLDLVAPGVSINSSIPGDSYAAFTGTSQAAPHVTGTIALLKQADSSLLPNQIADILRNTAYWNHSVNSDWWPDTPPSSRYGYGRLDSYAALLDVLYFNSHLYFLPHDNDVIANHTFEGIGIYVLDNFTFNIEGQVTLDKNSILNDRPSSLNVLGTLAGPSNASLNLIDNSTLNFLAGGTNNFNGEINWIVQDQLTFYEDTVIDDGLNFKIESGGKVFLEGGASFSTELGTEFIMEPNTEIVLSSSSMQKNQGENSTVITSIDQNNWKKTGSKRMDDYNINVVPKFELDNNYPNPFNPVTVIRYQLPVSSYVNLKIYDMLGREVASLVNGIIPAGQHEVRFDASNLSSGIYIYRIKANNFVETRQMTLIK